MTPREPAKAARKLSAITTTLKPGWHLPGLDAAFPPNRVDYECRPYEFGWLLWSFGGRSDYPELTQRAEFAAAAG